MIFRYRLNKTDKLLTSIVVRDIYMYSDKFGFIAGTIQKDGKQQVCRLRFHAMETLDY